MRRRLLHRRRLNETGRSIVNTTLINDPSLRLYCQFNGNGNDYYGNYNAISTLNVGYNPQGKFGRAAVFSGDGYFRFPDSVSYNLSQTICFWENTQSGAQFSKGSDAVNGWGIQLFLGNAFIVSNGVTYNSSITPNHGVWRHKAIIIDYLAKKLKVYIDGVLHSSTTISGDSLRGTTDVYLGATNATGTPANFYTGEISDFGWFKRVLSEAEIQHLAKGTPIA